MACVRADTSDAGWNGAALIRAARRAQNEAIAVHDLDRVATYWSPDVTVTASSGDVVLGRDAYRTALAGVFERFHDATYVRTPDTVEQSTVPGFAMERGRWTGMWTDGAVATRTTGEYMAMWRLDNDEWLIRSEMFVALSCSGCDK